MPESNTTTVIGPDTLIRGEMTFQSAARILGKFEGRLVGPGQIEIGEGSHCKATVEAGTVVVEGAVEGDIVARERLELNPTAHVKGDIVALKLIVAEGASFSGHVAVGPEAVKAAAPARPETAGAPTPAPAIKTARSGPRLSAETHNDLDATLAGLESKLAAFGKARSAAE